MNEKDIKSLKWEKDKEYSLGNSLYLRVRKSSKTHIIRKKKNNKRQVITLGKHTNLSLKDARYQAMQLSRQNLSNSIFGELVEKYWKEVAGPVTKVPNQVRGYLNMIDREFGHRKVIDVNRAMLVA